MEACFEPDQNWFLVQILEVKLLKQFAKMNSKKKVCKFEAKAIDNLFSWKSFEAICKTILAQKAKSQAQEQLKEYFSFPAKIWIFL